MRRRAGRRRCAGRGAFGRLGVLLVGEVARARLVGEQHGDVVAGKAGRLEIVHDPLGLAFRLAMQNTALLP